MSKNLKVQDSDNLKYSSIRSVEVKGEYLCIHYRVINLKEIENFVVRLTENTSIKYVVLVRG